MKRFGVAFSGSSNSGKTTLIEKISIELQGKKEVAIIKHDPKDKAIFDTIGKDSHRFFETGAKVIVSSPTRTTYFSHTSQALDELIELFGRFDLLLVEGLKTVPLPRISIFRNEIDVAYLSVSQAIAIDDSIDLSLYEIPKEIDILDLNDTLAIIAWIEKNAKAI
ncbi:MAG: molybdopterin-guanine dinucleotide biosynthesis protein B [Sulfurovum sp.]|nr:MAG: molybdopterin-guanine dinucleotide biosynthesis protein B [Sulfurovum sp.]